MLEQSSRGQHHSPPGLNSSVSSSQVEWPHPPQGQYVRQNASFAEDQSTSTAEHYLGYNNNNKQERSVAPQHQRVPVPQFSPTPAHHHQHGGYEHGLQHQQQQQHVYLRQSQMSPSQMMTHHQDQLRKQQHPQPPPAVQAKSGADPTVTTPPSFPPQPTPRKINNGGFSHQHTPTMYQNVPHNSKAYSDPRPLASSGRLETATPNRLSERFDSDRSGDSQLSDPFRRSASARLPKHKHRGSDYGTTAAMQDESDDSKRNSDQVSERRF
jgi:hypothetical protein